MNANAAARTARTRFAAAATIAAAALLAGSAEARNDKPAPPASRTDKAAVLSRAAATAKVDAVRKARRNGWRTKGTTADGAGFELIEIAPTGVPVYYQTLISNVAISSGATELRLAGGPTGAGVLVGVWDQSGARTSHQVFMADGVANVWNKDTSSMAAHSTAVAGVIGANGPAATTIGVAPAANIHMRTWGGDTAEMYLNSMFAPTDGKMQISNHSYGSTHGWTNGNYAGVSGWYFFGAGYSPDGSGAREDANFGAYGARSAQIDQIAWEARYYLPIRSAGNDRNDAFGGSRNGDGVFYYVDPATWMWMPTYWNAATAPRDEKADDGYDTIIMDSTAKNAIAVGSVTDPVIAGVRAPQAATLAAYSAFGPTDDGRVKPDLVANGETVYAPGSSTNTAYQTVSGTSFSAPAVTGVGALVIQEADELFPGSKLRASTLKALLLHGATDLGRPGPDFQYGWGLVDAVASIEPLVRQAAEPETLSMNEGAIDEADPTETYTVAWDGQSEFAATLCWTDPAAQNDVAPEVDNRTPKLVHDLDLRVVAADGSTFLPFTLDPNNPTADAVAGDNTVDNVEQVRIAPGAAPAGVLKVTVSRKSALREGAQEFGLVMTGQDAAPEIPEIAVETTSAETGTIVPVEIPTAALSSGATAVLRSATGAKIVASSSAAAGTTTFSFDLTNAEPGPWTMTFAGADGLVVASFPFEVLAATPTTLFLDGFESGSLSNWLATGASVVANKDIPAGEASSAEIARDGLMAAAIDTTGRKDIMLQYALACRTLPSGAFLAVDITTDGGATWNEIDRVASAQRWATRSVALPRTANGNDGFAVRFRASDADGTAVRIDNVAVTGVSQTAWSARGTGQTLLR